MVQTWRLSLLRLVLRCDLPLTDGFPVRIASSCSQLRHLAIRGALIGAVPPELGQLAGLTRLELERSSVASLRHNIMSLTELMKVVLRTNKDLIRPSGLTACKQLTWLEMNSDWRSAASHAAVPAPPMRLLCPPQQPHEAYWTRLAAVTELQLICQDSPPAGLGGMTSLRKITMGYSMEMDSLPAGP
jgi:hypothetical protein